MFSYWTTVKDQGPPDTPEKCAELMTAVMEMGTWTEKEIECEHVRMLTETTSVFFNHYLRHHRLRRANPEDVLKSAQGRHTVSANGLTFYTDLFITSSAVLIIDYSERKC
jgi:hypothetical protein